MTHDDEFDRTGNRAKERSDNEALTDLQKLIVQAIVCSESGSASTDEIEQYVAQFWTKLKKRDGSSYAYDCRRVVLASLSNASNIRPLFVRDPDVPDEQRWKIGPRGDDLGIKPDEVPFVDVSQKLGGAGGATRVRSTRQKRLRGSSPAVGGSNGNGEKRGKSASSGGGGGAALIQSTLANLAPAQHAVATFLYQCADNAAHISDISDALQRGAFVSGSRGECRRQTELILEVEPGFTPFVVRQDHAGNTWALANDLAAELDDAHIDDLTAQSVGGDDDSAAPSKRSRSASPLPPSRRTAGGGGGGGGNNIDDDDVVTAAPGSSSGLSAIFGEGDVSTMQETLMGIVLEHGGSAHIETISELAAQRIPSMRKKNMDVRRSIVASLSHNPPGFFRKHSRKPGFWTITPRGRLLADAMMASSADRAKFSLSDIASGSE